MYKNELDRHIQNKTLENNFVFFGESSYFIDSYTEIVSKLDDANTLTYYHDEYDFKSAKAHLSQSSLFGGSSVLIVKSEKKVHKKELDILIDLCEKNQDNLFVYAYYGSDHKTYTKAFSKKRTIAVRFFNPKDFEAQNIVADMAKVKGVNIDKYSISHLLQIHSSDVALACNELDKLAVFDRAITTKDIESLVFGLGEINIDDLIKKILLKQDFREDLQNILHHGEDEIRVLTAITTYLTQLYMFLIYIKVNGTPNALAILGYPAPSFVVEEKAKLSYRLKPSTYYKLHEILLDSELKMKSTSSDNSAILLSTIIRVQNHL